jgi:peptidyl-prolyl cis-trans isomerase SurA
MFWFLRSIIKRSEIFVNLKVFVGALVLVAASVVSPGLVTAQEGEPVVVDEVIAQVGDGIVTLSQLKREMKERVQTLIHNGMTEPQAQAEVEKRKAELIAILINEQLLLQKGKELDFTKGVEDEVNRRMLAVAKENNITSIEKLNEAMRQTGMDPAATRQTMRIEIMKQAVLESEVDRKLYFSFRTEEVQQYYEKNKGKFLKPESVDLSEIFLSVSDKQDAEVKARADQLVAQVRGGADFCALAAAYSERPGNNGQKPCKVGLFQLPDLRPDIANAIKNVKTGGVSEPLKSDGGYQILRVDNRTAGSATATFNENQVRGAMTEERSPKAREEYLQKLRNDSYVKIAENYREAVEPLLKIVPPSPAARKASNKDKEKDKKATSGRP